MKKLILIIVAITAIIMPGMVSGQSQITRPTKETEHTTSKPNKQTQTKQRNIASQTKISEPDGYINGHGFVDLGLPSGTKWATCNIGASKPSDYGEYFAWGETSIKNEYTPYNSLTNKKTLNELQTDEIVNSSNNLNKSNDVAGVKWGMEWRLPTLQEFEELIDYCTWKWESKGFVVIGPNGSSIYIPNAGYRYYDDLFYCDKIGHYWSSSATDASEYSFSMYLNGGKEILEKSRYCGLPIRPILE